MDTKQITEEKKIGFALNTKKIVKGTRRLVREKVLQILMAHFVSDISIDFLIDHIFNRSFNVENEYEDANKNDKLSDNKVVVDEERLADANLDSLISWRQQDQEFAMLIINATIKNYNSFVEYIRQTADNWDFNRIATTDRIIMMIAMSEFLFIPDVPVKVSINEALELAKNYSTEKSTAFVNGMLEKIKGIFEDKKLIHKSDRGLQ
ncbi:MAG: transcription antitermination factor NusB [Bacteroidetes bacterium]|nr:transcription antitermination factor NusB [Bacteroidota bacterium]